MPDNIESWRAGIWTKLDWKRFWLHLPVGIVCAVLAYYLPILGILAFIGFLTFEIIEDWRISDFSFKDVLGFNCGFIATSLALLILK